MTLDFLLSDNVPRIPWYGIYISQLVRCAWCFTSVFYFHSKTLQITSKILTQGYRYHKLRKTFGNFFGSYFELLSKFAETWFQEYVSKEIPHRVVYGDLVYRTRRVKGEANFISSGLEIVKRLLCSQYDPAIIKRTIGIVISPFTASSDHSLRVALWLKRRLGLCDGPCLNLLRGDRVLIPVPSYC